MIMLKEQNAFHYYKYNIQNFVLSFYTYLTEDQLQFSDQQQFIEQNLNAAEMEEN